MQRVALWTRGPRKGDLLLLEEEPTPTIKYSCREGWLICPVDGCRNPAFIPAAGPKQTPHFRHTSGARGHGDESEIHLQAKAVLARWAQESAPDAGVRVEPREGQRRPDIQVRHEAAGWSSAIEYQRSALPVDGDERSWAARQDELADHHDHVIWLLDPIRVEDHPTNSYGVVASDLLLAMARRGLPVRVLDVGQRCVTSIVPWRQGTRLLGAMKVYGGFAGTRAREHFIQFDDALDKCVLVDGRMITPTDRRLAELGLDYRLDPKHEPRPQQPAASPPAAPVDHGADVDAPGARRRGRPAKPPARRPRPDPRDHAAHAPSPDRASSRRRSTPEITPEPSPRIHQPSAASPPPRPPTVPFTPTRSAVVVRAAEGARNSPA